MFLNTFFSVSEAVLFAQLVDRLDQVRRGVGRGRGRFQAPSLGTHARMVSPSRPQSHSLRASSLQSLLGVDSEDGVSAVV